MERRHARFGSSNAHRWLVCPASVKDDAPPEIPNPEREEGLEAHAKLAKSFDADAVLTGDESVDFALQYIDDLKLHSLSIERYCRFPQDIVPREDCGGTPDVFGWRDNAAFVIDYKHGAGVLVEAEENEQLLFNAVAALWRMPTVDSLTGIIIQPRHWNGTQARTCEIAHTDLVEFKLRVDDALRRAVAEPDPEVPGTHCQFCPRAVICKAREAMGLAVVGLTDVREAPVLPAPEDLPLDKLSHILENGAILSQWLKDVRKYAFDLAARRKVAIPGFKVVEAKPKRSFTGETMEIAQKLAELSYHHFAADDFAPQTIVGIGDAEKMLKTAAKANAHYHSGSEKTAVQSVMERFALLTTKASSGSLTLVPLSDPRPPINPALAFRGVVLPAEEE